MASVRDVKRFFQLGTGWLWGLVVVASAETGPDEPLASLLRNSPFTTHVVPSGTPAADKLLEFRGVYVDAGEFFFSFYETSSRSSRWVGLKEGGNPFVVQSYDAAKGEVRVDYQGRAVTLELEQPRIVASAAPSIPANVSLQLAAGGSAPAVTAGVSDESVRAAKLAEEISRRRASRQQGRSQSTPAPPPAAPPQ